MEDLSLTSTLVPANDPVHMPKWINFIPDAIAASSTNLYFTIGHVLFRVDKYDLDSAAEIRTTMLTQPLSDYELIPTKDGIIVVSEHLPPSTSVWRNEVYMNHYDNDLKLLHSIEKLYGGYKVTNDGIDLYNSNDNSIFTYKYEID